ncbi:MAG: nitroreductase family protein [bacterium]|nr:nitroreductase family protein [bacterium]
MNKVLQNIQERRSVRFYKQKTIPQNILKQIIDVGNQAPTAMNTQNFRFIVIQEKTILDRLRKLAIPKYQEWLKDKPEFVKARRAKVDVKTSDPVYYFADVVIVLIGYGMTSDFDCPMVCENMMLAARALDVGSCWVYLGQLGMEDPEIQKILELKEGEIIYGPILFGYPKDDFPQSPSKKPPLVKWI